MINGALMIIIKRDTHGRKASPVGKQVEKGRIIRTGTNMAGSIF